MRLIAPASPCVANASTFHRALWDTMRTHGLIEFVPAVGAT